uniref:F-box domain-containing protein n=1 Tax=Fagus sylvatica TaxID=28930 RepID=A0A2N9HSX7_FAGSY
MADKNVNWDSLPVEIVTQILIRLPIKSIIISTSVCKTWKSLIQNPTFIPTHLHHSINNNNHHHLLFRLCQDGKEIYALHNDDDDDFTEHTRFDFPFHAVNDNTFRVVGTCNGLVCLSDDLIVNKVHHFFLWNPCVRKFVKLPYPNLTYKTHGGVSASIGFGFDAKTNDYKVVRMVNLPNPNSNSKNLRRDRPKVEVYTLSTGEWRMVTAALPPICTVLGLQQVAFVNGALHWLAFRWTDDDLIYHFVLVFELEDEVFREIQLPELPGYENTYDLDGPVSVYKNCLALFKKRYYRHYRIDFFENKEGSSDQNIWVMKEYGVASSWTKVFTITDQDPDMPFAIGFRRNGEFVLQVESGQLISVDVGNQKMKDLGISSDKNAFVDSYVESLVLLDKAANGAVTY